MYLLCTLYNVQIVALYNCVYNEMKYSNTLHFTHIYAGRFVCVHVGKKKHTTKNKWVHNKSMYMINSTKHTVFSVSILIPTPT